MTFLRGCSSKLAHESYDDAFAHLKSLVWFNACRRQERLSKGLNIYQCEHCARWHVGHRRPDLVWHYTTGEHARLIFRDGFLRPRGWTRTASQRLWNAHRIALLSDRVPLLWFSRNHIYEPTACKGTATPAGIVVMSREQTEVYGGGLFRFGVDASVAPLRWCDHVALNHVTKTVARFIRSQGYPPNWLAARRAIPLSRCHAIELFYRGEWLAVTDVPPADFNAYLSERMQEEAIRRQADRDALTVATVRRQATKVGRNDWCSCGSKQKFKRCCGARETVTVMT
jgi:hypothetical protein